MVSPRDQDVTDAPLAGTSPQPRHSITGLRLGDWRNPPVGGKKDGSATLSSAPPHRPGLRCPALRSGTRRARMAAKPGAASQRARGHAASRASAMANTAGRWGQRPRRSAARPVGRQGRMGDLLADYRAMGTRIILQACSLPSLRCGQRGDELLQLSHEMIDIGSQGHHIISAQRLQSRAGACEPPGRIGDLLAQGW